MANADSGQWSGSAGSGEQDGGDGDGEGGADSGSTLWGILVMLLVGGTLIGGGLSLQPAQPGPDSTEAVESTVVDSSYGQRDSGPDREFTVRVTDEYEIDGGTCRSSNVKVGPTSYTVEQRSSSETLVTRQWAPGHTIEAHVDPDDPETSFLAEYLPGDRAEETIGHHFLMLFGALAVLASVTATAKKAFRGP